MDVEGQQTSREEGTCLVCGQWRMLCWYGRCRLCHAHRRSRREEGRVNQVPAPPDAVPLCCGWWGPLSVLPWTCLTCGALRRRDA